MKVVNMSALCTGRLYTPGNIPGTHFFWRLSRPQGLSVDAFLAGNTDNIACSYTILICIFFLLFPFCYFLILQLLYISYFKQYWCCQLTCDPYIIAGSINEATWQTQIVSTAAHYQHWMCSRMHKQNTLTSPFPEHTTAMQKFCQHWPSMNETV